MADDLNQLAGPLPPVHLGDGAYASEGRYRGELVLTANHHDPVRASDKVYLDPAAVSALLGYIERMRRG